MGTFLFVFFIDHFTSHMPSKGFYLFLRFCYSIYHTGDLKERVLKNTIYSKRTAQLVWRGGANLSIVSVTGPRGRISAYVCNARRNFQRESSTGIKDM